MMKHRLRPDFWNLTGHFREHPPPHKTRVASSASMVVTALDGYMDINTINKGKRDEIVKKFYWK
jgi:hypothetical protein